jgi:hypothetical protein
MLAPKALPFKLAKGVAGVTAGVIFADIIASEKRKRQSEAQKEVWRKRKGGHYY